jgi:hypothetical protein
MVLDLIAMLTALETNTFYLTGMGIVLSVVTYQIGIQRNLLTGIIFSALVMIAYGSFMYHIAPHFITVGFLILVIIAPIIWLMSNKQTDKVGGTP